MTSEVSADVRTCDWLGESVAVSGDLARPPSYMYPSAYTPTNTQYHHRQIECKSSGGSPPWLHSSPLFRSDLPATALELVLRTEIA
jgi:hypothetical protein